MLTIRDYFEKLAEEFLRHSPDECHFSDALNYNPKLARLMHYPCMRFDVGNFAMGGQPGSESMTVIYNLYFLSHVRDTHDLEEIDKVFAETYRLALRVIKRMKDAVAENDPSSPARYFDFSTVEGERIEFADAGLFGYAVTFAFRLPFDYMACIMDNEFGLSLP